MASLVDAVLTTSDEVSIVFGFSWSYFFVETERPSAVVEFLASIMPLKRIDELYNAIGFNKHGKTELYRSLVEHMARPDARFDFAEGDEGLVMSVFTLPSLNVVFKIIKDRFGHPKRITRTGVLGKYHLVFVRDRVGRLADAQEFEHLAFPRRLFPDELLAHLRAVAPSIVRVEDEHVIIAHLYTERRVTPLNVFLRDATPEEAADAILDYGAAIKDLAAANIFTGDMLLKNFGVSRHGRVIFYDYDELCLLTECNIRSLPQPRTRRGGDGGGAMVLCGRARCVSGGVRRLPRSVRPAARRFPRRASRPAHGRVLARHAAATARGRGRGCIPVRRRPPAGARNSGNIGRNSTQWSWGSARWGARRSIISLHAACRCSASIAS